MRRLFEVVIFLSLASVISGCLDSSGSQGIPVVELSDSDLDGVPDVSDPDDDNDGVLDVDDAFPLDALEFRDTDADGIGNSADTDDDNDDVADVLDAFPLDPLEHEDTDSDGIGNNADTDDDDDGVSDANDSAPLNNHCHAAEDVESGQCLVDIVDAAIAVSVDNGGVIYFLLQSSKKLYRWDTNTQAFLSTVQLGTITPSDAIVQKLVVSNTHGRVYLGYGNGSITFLDIAGMASEQPFTNLAAAVGGLASAGEYLLAQDDSGAWETHYVFDRNGLLTASLDWNHYSRVYAWNEALSRIYFFRDTTSPNDIHYEDIDQLAGTIIGSGESPYHGDYEIAPPLITSGDGQSVLIGSGNVFDAVDLTWKGAVSGGIVDALWDSTAGMVVLRTVNGNTALERRDTSLRLLESVNFEGDAVRFLSTSTGYWVLSSFDGGIIFSAFTPSNDSDNDGVTNDVDAFPTDPAASLDSDRDGYPDSWNVGKTQLDSTTGLSIDAYPLDAACYAAADGDGVNCDYNKVIPVYTPDDTVIDVSGVIYLLSGENSRVYRWSISDRSYIAPLVVGTTVKSPQLMEYSASHQRLYFGYDDGKVTYIDLASLDFAETEFVSVAAAVGGIASVGNYLLIQDPSGAWNTHYIYDSNGALMDSVDWNEYSRAYAWSDTLNRVYFFRDGTSPNDLHYEQISPVTGAIEASGETPYHGDYTIMPPILLSPDESSVMLGSGDRYDTTTLNWIGAIASSFNYGVWLPTRELITLREVSGISRIDRYDSSLNWSSEQDFAGTPAGLFALNATIILVTTDGNGVSFIEYVVP